MNKHATSSADSSLGGIENQSEPRLRVLVAASDPIDQRILGELLTRWGCNVEICPTGQQAWRTLQREDPPQVAILDSVLPGPDGLEICRRARAAAREPSTYILLMTARLGSDAPLVGIEAGADDFLGKPFDAHELRVRLFAARRTVELRQELTRMRVALQESMYDGLTQALNRAAIAHQLRDELSRAGRQGGTVAVLLADLDYFKKVNDTFGHLFGDAVLVEAAQRMRLSLRCYDSLGRYGGEEFLMILPGCHSRDARQLAERVRHRITSEPFHCSGQTVNLTVSIGLAWRDAARNGDAAALLREADAALYAAKDGGRNRVEESRPERARLTGTA